MRADLLSLTADDLASFSNRGLTRRAEQEVTAGSLTCELDESPQGDVTARWSDGVECRLPAKARLTDGRCTCPATTLCRHVLRTVFAYQKLHTGSVAPQMAHAQPVQAIAEPAKPMSKWNPAEISDEQLAPYISAPELTRWHREFAAGHVIQVWTGTKPRAVLHTLGCAVDFRVPHDVRYAACDCAGEAPCGHVALAIWAFRRLSPGQTTGLISTSAAPTPVSPSLLKDIEGDLSEVVRVGLARTPPLQVDKWRRLADRAQDAGLIWPAEVLRELADMHTAYLTQDARFAPRDFAAAAAELLQRMDAVRTNRSPVPTLFVRGSVHDRETEFGSARLIGLGCSARTHRGGTELVAHLQDCDSGTIVAITRDFADPSTTSGKVESPRLFADLARTVVLKGASLAALGRGQLLIKGGRRTPSGRFLPGRAAASVSPQAYAWETLRVPVRVAGFAELREQLRTAPPAVLGPRRIGARLVVCPLHKASDVEFSTAHQKIFARLTDPEGNFGLMALPYVSRAAAGAEQLLAMLRRSPDSVRFIAAQAQLAGPQVILSPLTLVFEQEGRRSCVQPWTDDASAQKGPLDPAADHASRVMPDPLHDYLEELQDRVAETWLTGVKSTTSAWPRLAGLGASLGFRRLANLTDLDKPERLLELTVLSDFAYREFARLEATEPE